MDVISNLKVEMLKRRKITLFSACCYIVSSCGDVLYLFFLKYWILFFILYLIGFGDGGFRFNLEKIFPY